MAENETLGAAIGYPGAKKTVDDKQESFKEAISKRWNALVNRPSSLAAEKPSPSPSPSKD